MSLKSFVYESLFQKQQRHLCWRCIFYFSHFSGFVYTGQYNSSCPLNSDSQVGYFMYIMIHEYPDLLIDHKRTFNFYIQFYQIDCPFSIVSIDMSFSYILLQQYMDVNQKVQDLYPPLRREHTSIPSRVEKIRNFRKDREAYRLIDSQIHSKRNSRKKRVIEVLYYCVLI